MEAVLLIGIQASGKTTFYQQRFAETHVRISMDMLRTRRRERLLMEACLAGGTRYVIDNTNPTAADRAGYIAAAREAGFRVVGYFFEPDPKGAFARNAQREGARRIPPAGLFGTLKRLERPAVAEGFDELYRVTIPAPGEFGVEPWDGEPDASPAVGVQPSPAVPHRLTAPNDWLRDGSSGRACIPAVTLRVPT